MALEVKVMQSLSANSKTAAEEVSLQSNQSLNSICAFLFCYKVSQVPRLASGIPELSQVSSFEKFVTDLTPTLEQ